MAPARAARPVRHDLRAAARATTCASTSSTPRYPPRAQGGRSTSSSALLAVADRGARDPLLDRTTCSSRTRIGEISSDPGGLTHRWVLKALIPLGFALFALQAAAQGVVAAARVAGAGARGVSLQEWLAIGLLVASSRC